MRLAGQLKNGYFPIPPPVIDLILRHLKPPKPTPASLKHFRPDDITILDPCAGEGVALVQLAQALDITPEHTFAIELNTTRAARITEAYPDIKVLGPCPFEFSRITRHAFSLVYVNPPFDHEYGGGGRQEVSFVRAARDMLAVHGVLVLVCPLNQVWGKPAMVDMLDLYFREVEIYVFPEALRDYGECVVIGRRRRETLHPEKLLEAGLHLKDIHNSSFEDGKYGRRPTLSVPPVIGNASATEWIEAETYPYGFVPNLRTMSDGPVVWELPFAWAPKTFEKIMATPEELEVFLESSPNYAKMEGVVLRKPRRPALGLNKGHTSLVLLNGMLDGYVPSEPPHVVRGFCGKAEVKVRSEDYSTEDGTPVHKDVYSQVPKPCVRVAWGDGTIQTLSESVATVADTAVLEAEPDEDEQ